MIDGYQFTKKRQTEKAEEWRCRTRKPAWFRAKAFTKDGMVLSSYNVHNHDIDVTKNQVEQIERKIVKAHDTAPTNRAVIAAVKNELNATGLGSHVSSLKKLTERAQYTRSKCIDGPIVISFSDVDKVPTSFLMFQDYNFLAAKLDLNEKNTSVFMSKFNNYCCYL